VSDKKIDQNQTVQLVLDPNLKTVWIDNIYMAKRLDGVSIVRLSTHLPEGMFEQLRFMASEQSLKNFVDIICTTLNYYPDEKSIEEKSHIKV